MANDEYLVLPGRSEWLRLKRSTSSAALDAEMREAVTTGVAVEGSFLTDAGDEFKLVINPQAVPWWRFIS